jgi:hypothetical protein
MRLWDPEVVPTVYRLTYPNGKIFVEHDLTDQITYVGSIANDLFRADFPDEQARDFTVRKEILWQSDTTDHDEVERAEIDWIVRLRANDPTVGYNRWPPLEQG